MYVKSKVRKGLLGRMLAELLDTRVMVKQAMKSVSGDKVGSLGIYNVNKGTDT
jgi:DNA polymerase zeta